MTEHDTGAYLVPICTRQPGEGDARSDDNENNKNGDHDNSTHICDDREMCSYIHEDEGDKSHDNDVSGHIHDHLQHRDPQQNSDNNESKNDDRDKCVHARDHQSYSHNNSAETLQDTSCDSESSLIHSIPCVHATVRSSLVEVQCLNLSDTSMNNTSVSNGVPPHESSHDAVKLDSESGLIVTKNHACTADNLCLKDATTCKQKDPEPESCTQKDSESEVCGDDTNTLVHPCVNTIPEHASIQIDMLDTNSVHVPQTQTNETQTQTADHQTSDHGLIHDMPDTNAVHLPQTRTTDTQTHIPIVDDLDNDAKTACAYGLPSDDDGGKKVAGVGLMVRRVAGHMTICAVLENGPAHGVLEVKYVYMYVCMYL